MGKVVDPSRAFKVCHGYKVDGELFLWSKGVRGLLNNNQEYLCQKIVIENAKGGPRVFLTVEEAKAAKVEEEVPKEVKHMVAMRTCASLLDEAENEGLIGGVNDVYAFMDYCMYKHGFDELKRKVPEKIRTFIDEHLSDSEDKISKIVE